MSDSTAREYADYMIASIKADDIAGLTFGVSDDPTHTVCGEPVEIDRDEQDTYCAECDERIGFDEVEGIATAYDYLEDALDIRYLINADRTFRAGQVAITLGGPNVWIDTEARELQVYWGGDCERRHLPADFVNGIDDALAEMWEMGA